VIVKYHLEDLAEQVYTDKTNLERHAATIHDVYVLLKQISKKLDEEAET
jgi:hypothetical protein